jgi:putative membrane protein
LVIIVGVLRVIYGAKGADYYLHNPWFWAKMASFAAVGVLSLPPTVRFLAWRRALKADPDFVPGAWEIARIRLWLRLELALIVLIVTFAAAMARYGG